MTAISPVSHFGRARALADPGPRRQEVFSRTPWGLYDMHGNVYEWVQDWYHDHYDGAPNDGSAWLSGGDKKVIRSGAYGSNAGNLRSAVRHMFTPDARTGSLGFRVVAVARPR